MSTNNTTLYKSTSTVSIPKGAIMSRAAIFTLSRAKCFNSKRCDYESSAVTVLLSKAQVSIPKGAIMSKFACPHQKCWLCFNSKRCDYEFLEEQNIEFISCFNSKRCDYEELDLHLANTIMSFNSKRCDYEQEAILIIAVLRKVSIPKGAIMSF